MCLHGRNKVEPEAKQLTVHVRGWPSTGDNMVDAEERTSVSKAEPHAGGTHELLEDTEKRLWSTSSEMEGPGALGTKRNASPTLPAYVGDRTSEAGMELGVHQGEQGKGTSRQSSQHMRQGV